ncbi:MULTISPECIES: NlpC/P60 family protein [unclassified Streptomyces]|uniref:C40 family peptidase n=1 Tax=unclassified Streptomyces TaxID=2593676 RepID=UPI000CD4EBBA|nr:MULTISPECIES: C40 family peptidase [unclassified Streptomyces]
MGSHRRPRPGLLSSPAVRRGAIGLGVAALSATLISQQAHADDGDAVAEARKRAEASTERAAEVKERVDTLYREAGSATQRYNAAEEKTAAQQETVDALLNEAAAAADEVNEARRTVGQFAAAQYRHGNVSETATLLLVDNPQSFFDLRYKLDRVTGQQQHALDIFSARQGTAQEKRSEATEALASLQEQEETLQAEKESVQEKLATARELLEGLTEEEAEQLAELERLEREEAERKAEERRQRERAERERREAAEREEAERAEAERAEQDTEPGAGTEPPAQDPPPATPPPSGGGGYTAKAEKVLAFAEAELGKPYVWGATGPGSYDCSGFTQAAWRTAGVEMPRVTYDQVNFGTRVSRGDMLPGDLVFFYSDISHVGIYIGDGNMIHASRPGDVVKVEPVDYMPFHSAVRPA